METVSDYVKAISAQGRDMHCVILHEDKDALIEATLGFKQTVYNIVDERTNNVFQHINTSEWNKTWTSSLCAMRRDMIIVLDCKGTYDIIPKCMSRISNLSCKRIACCVWNTTDFQYVNSSCTHLNNVR